MVKFFAFAGRDKNNTARPIKTDTKGNLSIPAFTLLHSGTDIVVEPGATVQIVALAPDEYVTRFSVVARDIALTPHNWRLQYQTRFNGGVIKDFLFYSTEGVLVLSPDREDMQRITQEVRFYINNRSTETRTYNIEINGVL